MDCTIPALLIALKQAVAQIPSQELMGSTNLVCGCECAKTRSEMLECWAAEARADERWLEQTNGLIAACEADQRAQQDPER